MELLDIRKSLDERGVDTKNLAVFMLGGGEQIIGEVVPNSTFSEGDEYDSVLTGVGLRVKNPKRILRIQERAPNGAVAFGYLMGDLDMVESGVIEIRANAAYFVLNLGPESQIAVFSTYLDYLQRRMENKAREAGLHLPNKGLIQP